MRNSKTLETRPITTLFLLTVFVILVFPSACMTSRRPSVPQKTMLLRTDSVPAGATVYSYKDGIQGERLGTTPLEMEIGASSDFDGSNYSVWFYSPDDCVTAQKKDSNAGVEYDLFLNCVVFADRYHPKFVVNEFIARCTTRYKLRFHDRDVTPSFSLEPAILGTHWLSLLGNPVLKCRKV